MSAPTENKIPPQSPPPYSYYDPTNAAGVHGQYPPNAQPPPPPNYGFQPPIQQQPIPEHYGATVVSVQPQVVILNGCPNCRQGVLETEFSCLGIFCAIFFFPIGILCCLLTQERRCSNCRLTV